MPEPTSSDRLQHIFSELRAFRSERGWESFHTLKDLAAAISVEAAELQEILLWTRSEDERAALARRRAAIVDELADIFIFCLNFADVAEIDVLQAVEQKIQKNQEKYPSRGDGRSARPGED